MSVVVSSVHASIAMHNLCPFNPGSVQHSIKHQQSNITSSKCTFKHKLSICMCNIIMISQSIITGSGVLPRKKLHVQGIAMGFLLIILVRNVDIEGMGTQ